MNRVETERFFPGRGAVRKIFHMDSVTVPKQGGKGKRMAQALRKVWVEEPERQPEKKQPVVRRSHRRRPVQAMRAYVDTDLRFKALVLFVLFAVTATVTLVRSEVSAMRGYELVQLRQQAIQLEQENKGLELKIAELKAPQRIKDLATNELGMVVPKEFYFAEGKR